MNALPLRLEMRIGKASPSYHFFAMYTAHDSLKENKKNDQKVS
jgi:hypothetical protein